MKDRVRLLAKTNGYTDRIERAMDRDEPEAVDPDSLAEITARSAATWPGIRALQSGERSARPLARRIQDVKAQARATGIDVHPQMRLVRLAMESGRPIEHVERRLRAVENRLWPTP